MNINYISAIGLAISILFLLISCSIFTFSSALKSGRVVMHNNLCLSLLASSVFWLVWHFTVLGQHQVWAGNSVWCRLLHVLTTYLTISNYTWMLCEGAYLHCLLTIPFIEEEMLIKILRVFGWVSPSIFIIPYCVYRSYHENYHCWMDLGDSNWFLGVPVIIIIILNIVFLSNVLIIQRAKLRDTSVTSNTNTRTEVTVKQTRAAIFLIFLLGINFLLLPFRPEPGSSAVVSILLCFTNSQVKTFVCDTFLTKLRRVQDELRRERTTVF